MYNGDEYDLAETDSRSDSDSSDDNPIPGLDAQSFQREFTETYDVSGEQIPLSDHWGVSLDFAFDG